MDSLLKAFAQDVPFQRQFSRHNIALLRRQPSFAKRRMAPLKSCHTSLFTKQQRRESSDDVPN